MSKLSPQTLADCYTIEEINTKITFYSDALDSATVRMYDKDTGQGRQKVESEEIQNIESILQSWLKAKLIKTGNSGITIATIDYSPRRPNL